MAKNQFSLKSHIYGDFALVFGLSGIGAIIFAIIASGDLGVRTIIAIGGSILLVVGVWLTVLFIKELNK